MAPPPRYTEAQITAAVAAVLDEGISQQEAIRRAAAGTLAPGLDPFRLSKDALSRAKNKAELNRAKAAASADPRNSANLFARTVLAALEPSNKALLARLEGAKHVPPQLESALRDRAKTIREYVAMQGATERKQAQKTPVTPQPRDTPNLAALIGDNAPDTDTDPRASTRDTCPAHSSALANGDAQASSHGQ